MQIEKLIEQIIKSQKFVWEIKRCVQQCQSDLQSTSDKPTFAFEKSSKQLWTFQENNLPIEGQKVVEDIADMMTTMIDGYLHQILNRQFVNVTNQILVIRKQIDDFIKEQEQRTIKVKQEFGEQVQALKKKFVLSQNMQSNKEGYFMRTRTNATISASSSISHSTSHQNEKISSELGAIKKEIETLREEVKKQEGVGHLSEQLAFIEQKMQSSIVDLRKRIEMVSHKSEKTLTDFSLQLKETSSKKYISQEVSTAIKSYFKVYRDQIEKCKVDRALIRDDMAKTDKGLQEYFANQMKPLWMLIQDIKKRLSDLQRENNMNDRSMIFQ